MTKGYLKLFIALFIISSSSLLQKATALPGPVPISPNLFSSMEEALFRNDIIQFATSHVGIRYRYTGTTVDGFDCSGFTRYVLKYFNIEVSHCSTTQSTQGNLIHIKEAKPGDLIFFGHKKRRISHVAMVVQSDADHLYVVHSTCSRGVMVEDIYQSAYWKPKMKFAIDVIGREGNLAAALALNSSPLRSDLLTNLLVASLSVR